MRLRWTEEAAADLERIADYLLDNASAHTSRIVLSLYEAPETLLTFPGLGRTGRKDGTRELVLSSLPYLVVYSVSYDTVHVVRILHGAQKWP